MKSSTLPLCQIIGSRLFIPPQNHCFLHIVESAFLCVCVSVCMSVCLSVYKILVSVKSHSMTALVVPGRSRIVVGWAGKGVDLLVVCFPKQEQ